MLNENSGNEKDNWLRMVFKGNKVWVAKGEDDQISVNKGRVRIKYNLSQDLEYLVNPANLSSIDGLSEKKADKKKNIKKSGGAEKGKHAPESLPDSLKSGDKPENDPDTITIYTDGASSGNPGPSGIGVYLSYGRHEKEISEYIGEATNNIAELEAIRRALSEIKNRNLPLKIHSDSSYAIGLLTKGWKAQKNQELVADIKKLVSMFRNVEFIKVSGHSGIPGNEKADRLATGAIETYLKTKP